jgi:hypothetical protein
MQPLPKFQVNILKKFTKLSEKSYGNTRDSKNP